jgi:hypothetical protein
MEGEPFKRQTEYHQRATGFLRQALEFDEKTSILFFSKNYFYLLFILLIR